ncbi:O-antigen ligase [Fusobacterium simiae]|uniref:O-antigen ligase n=1 Tax=Fusobacterium simiae TaxID=855 RepID=A0ABT4DKG2_FUSSI|nr:MULTISPECIES: O-antigen polymerase [Fusobacterium]MCY7007861.1 O-antigen ligase [Fusobacterium simiae]
MDFYLVGPIFIFSYLENKLYKTGMTPLFVFLFPLTIAIILAELLDNSLNLKEYKILIFNVSLIWFSLGVLIRLFFLLFPIKQKKIDIKKFPKLFYYIQILVLIPLLITTIKAIFLLGITNIKGKARGIFAHIYILFSTFYLIPFYMNKKKFKKVYFIMTIVALLLHPKYETFLFLLPLFFYQTYKSRKIFKFKVFIISLSLILLMFIIFFLTYYLNFKINKLDYEFSDFLSFLIKHIQYYFLSPIYIGEYLLKYEKYGNPEVVVAPFLNIINWVQGDRNYIDTTLTFIDYLGIHSNVGGLIPELIYSIGKSGMYIFVTILAIYSYIVENLLLRNEIWIFTSLILKATLFLCFFSNVFSVLGYVERILGTMLITIFIIIYQIYQKSEYSKKHKKLK